MWAGFRETRRDKAVSQGWQPWRAVITHNPKGREGEGTWTQSHSWELLKLYCTYESLGRQRGAEELVSNEDSGSVGLCGPKILMCREFPLSVCS